MSNLRLALTDKSLIGLPLAHDHPYIARDTDLGGFFVVIGKTSKTFTIQADLHGEEGSRTSIRMATRRSRRHQLPRRPQQGQELAEAKSRKQPP